ncbi:MAG: TolC family protein, partial [Paracoccaceae bacterium]|nr:TolC family protein [Paracoccaceae bacterium]
AKESVLATREALIETEQRVLLQAVQAYVDVRLGQDTVALRESNMRLIVQELQAAQDRFDVGEITRTDVAIAEARLAAARSDLVAAQGALEVARENYKLAIGVFPRNLARLPANPRTARNLDEARGVAQGNHPSIRKAQREVTVSDINVARAKAAMGPVLTGRTGVGQRSDSNDTVSLSLNLSQTLYSGGRLSALFRQALARKDASRAGLHQTSAVIAQAVGEAWSNVSVANARIVASDQQIISAQTAYEGLREEATLGARTTLDVLDAEQELRAARTTRLSAEATRNISVYALLSAMGLLTVDHLKLGIPTYDPAAYYNAVKNAPATSAQGRKLDRVLKSIGQ